MSEKVYSKCGMRCDLCLVYRPNVEVNDRREEICKVFAKVWNGYEPNSKEIICDSCSTNKENAVFFSPDCRTRQCVMDKDLEHCGYCNHYPCNIFPAEPTQEELVQKIDVEKQWTWEDEKLMEAYTCKKNMDEFQRIMKNEFLVNLDKLHTTELGIIRIKKNLFLDIDNVVEWCKTKIKSDNAVITRKGKNWYVNVDDCIITVNAYSYTIITAHKE